MTQAANKPEDGQVFQPHEFVLAARLRARPDAAIKPSKAQPADVPAKPEEQPAKVIDGAALLDEVAAFIARFVALPSEDCLIAAALWAALTHMVEQFLVSPRLAVLSPELGSGKTRLLEIIALLVPEPMFCLNASPAAIFRTLQTKKITLLMDETDTIFTHRGKDDQNEDIRALLNAGYRRGAAIPRCVGPRHEVEMFSVYCATALAGLGDLPETLMSRSIVLRMRRRAPDEHVEPFRPRDHEPEGNAIRDRLAAWSGSGSSGSSAPIGVRAGAARPSLPDGVFDRPAELWEPLIAIADIAGGRWPEASRKACLALTAPGLQRVSLGIRLLGDLRIIFGEETAMHTETIIDRLSKPERNGLEADAPWGELNGGKPITDRKLATMLRKYGVVPVKVKVEGKSLQGYRREHLGDPWKRYLSPNLHSPIETELPEPPEPSGVNFAPENGSAVEFEP